MRVPCEILSAGLVSRTRYVLTTKHLPARIPADEVRLYAGSNSKFYMFGTCTHEVRNAGSDNKCIIQRRLSQCRPAQTGCLRTSCCFAGRCWWRADSCCGSSRGVSCRRAIGAALALRRLGLRYLPLHPLVLLAQRLHLRHEILRNSAGLRSHRSAPFRSGEAAEGRQGPRRRA